MTEDAERIWVAVRLMVRVECFVKHDEEGMGTIVETGRAEVAAWGARDVEEALDAADELQQLDKA